jgi:hypothetical protein
VLASWLLTGWMLLGQVAAAPVPSLAPLLAQLDAPDKADRDDAERQLLALGPAVLGSLPEPDDRMPAETRLRLTRIRSQLERAQADASVEASHVTLSGDKMPLNEVLAALEKQTGNHILDFRPQFGEQVQNRPISVKFQNTPFWPALDEILDQAGLTVYNFAGEDGLSIVGRSPSQLPRAHRADYSGAFRIEGTEFTAHRDLRDPASHTLELSVEAAWEPRLRPIVILQSADWITARDDQGQPLALSSKNEQLEINVTTSTHSIELPIHFALPPRSVKQISRLRGKLVAMLPGRAEDFRFDNLEKAKRLEQRRAGVTVVLDEAWKNNSVWELRVRVVFDKAGGALESHRTWVFNNEAWLETPTKEKLPYAGLETTRQGENEVGVSYMFSVPAGLAGHTFVYRTPVSISTVPITYELKDLELP